jgi:hypothetical protein
MNPARLHWRMRLVTSAIWIVTLVYLHEAPTNMQAIWYDSIITLVVLGVILSAYFEACSRMPPGFKKEQDVKAAERRLLRETT